jgi:ribulose 1,5-bisphosphate carboxylase large subunit-like protein
MVVRQASFECFASLQISKAPGKRQFFCWPGDLVQSCGNFLNAFGDFCDFPALVDQIHVNGIANKFWESDDSVVRSIEACLKPMFGDASFSIMPVVSSGQWGGQAPETYRRTKTLDLLYLAGGGIMAHPDGPEAGVRSLLKWWEAAVEGLTKEQAAAKYPDLKKSLDKFGGNIS